MGRPREFDEDEALARIMEVFWAKGFEGTSMRDLVAATGLVKGSLYAAFGDKRAMYLKALALYDRTAIDGAVDLLRGPRPPEKRIAGLLQAAIEPVAAKKDRRGCFLCNASIDQAALDPGTARAVTAALGRLELGLEEALSGLAAYARDGRRRKAAARHLLAVYFGLRVLAKAGHPVGALTDAKKTALSSILPAE